MKLIKNYMTNNDCYRTNKKITPTHIVVHDTGAKNRNIKRYVQPDIEGIGANVNNNDWNRHGVEKCVHAFIGELEDGSVATVQTLPWNYRAWHCGSGSIGSMNNYAISFEICQDLDSQSYFMYVYKEAVELCAFLCKNFNISVDNIICHKEAHDMGYASNHSDVMEWFPLYGKSMDDFRKDVKEEMEKDINNIPDSYAEEAWNWGIENGLTTGENPKNEIKRQDVMLMLYKFYEKFIKEG